MRDLIKVPMRDNPHLDRISRIKGLDINTGPWIGGGVLRRILVGDFVGNYDIDVFHNGECKELLESVKLLNYSDSPTKLGIAVLLNMVNLNDNVNIQLTKRDFTKPEELLEDFDFTVCQFISDGKDIYGPERAFHDLTHKRLRIGGHERSSPNRILRYMSYGYCPDTRILEVMARDPKEASYYESKAVATNLDISDGDLRDLQILGEIMGYYIDFEKEILMVGKWPMPLNIGLVYLLDQHRTNKLYYDHLKPIWSSMGLGMNPPSIRVTRGELVQRYRLGFSDDFNNLTVPNHI